MTIETWAREYETATTAFLEIADALSPDQLDIKHPDGWSPRQIIHHMADSEAQSYARIRRLLAEPGSIIQGYDEGAWAVSPYLGYETLPVDNSLAVLRAVRAASLDIIQRITPADLATTGVHTESGEYSVERWLTGYTKHPLDHADQLLKALQRLA